MRQSGCDGVIGTSEGFEVSSDIARAARGCSNSFLPFSFYLDLPLSEISLGVAAVLR